MAMRHSFDENDETQTEEKDKDDIKDDDQDQDPTSLDILESSKPTPKKKSDPSTDDEGDLGQLLRIWSSRYNKWRFGVVEVTSFNLIYFICGTCASLMRSSIGSVPSSKIIHSILSIG